MLSEIVTVNICFILIPDDENFTENQYLENWKLLIANLFLVSSFFLSRYIFIMIKKFIQRIVCMTRVNIVEKQEHIRISVFLAIISAIQLKLRPTWSLTCSSKIHLSLIQFYPNFSISLMTLKRSQMVRRMAIRKNGRKRQVAAIVQLPWCRQSVSSQRRSSNAISNILNRTILSTTGNTVFADNDQQQHT